MVSYAIIKACGKQFWVEPGRFYDFDKLPLDKDDVFTLNNVLLMNNNGDLSIGKPFLDSSFSLSARVIRHLSGSKIRVYKMRSKKKTRKTYGSRPKLTRVLIDNFPVRSEVSGSDSASSVCFL